MFLHHKAFSKEPDKNGVELKSLRSPVRLLGMLLIACSTQSVQSMDFLKQFFSCVLCLDSYTIDTLENNNSPDENHALVSSEVSDPTFTPRLFSFFNKTTTKKLLKKHPSLTLSMKECIKKSSLPLLKEYLAGYAPDNHSLEQKKKIMMMLTVLLQNKQNFSVIETYMPPKYMQKTCKGTNFLIRAFDPGKSDIFGYTMAVYQTQLKYIKPRPIRLLIEVTTRPVKISFQTTHKEQIKLLIEEISPLIISLERTHQDCIGPHAAALILQFLGDNFKYQFTSMLPCHSDSMLRRKLIPQKIGGPVIIKRNTEALIRDLR